MKIGCCVNLKEKDKIIACKDAGIDYIEGGFAVLHGMPKNEITSLVHLLRDNNLSLEAFNGMFPGDIRLTGEWVDYNKVNQYLLETLEKASVFCPKVVVFGSSASRNTPVDFSKEFGEKQLAYVLHKHMAPLFAKYGVTCAIEPLRDSESNIINTILEGDVLKEKSDAPQVKLLADFYHMTQNGESVEDFKKLSEPPYHLHIASKDRTCPHPDDGTDYASLFAVLKEIGYDGRISIEGRIDEPFEQTLRASVEYLRTFI